MIKVNDRNFYEQVIQKSKEVPVLVDFWAPWCQPCLIIGPILERLEDEYQGKFILAKLNVQENQAVASHFHVTAIPIVKLFKNGKVIDEFVGALPERKIREFLKKIKPGETDSIIKKGDEYHRLGKLEQARKEYEKVLEKDPSDEQLKYKLGVILFEQENFAEAKRNLKAIEHLEEAKKVLDIIYFKEIPLREIKKLRKELDKNPDNIESHLNLADQYAKAGNYKESLDEYLIVLEKDKKYKDEAARISMLKIFNILGEEDSLVKEYRRKLTSVLF